MAVAVSPLAPESRPTMPVIAGVRLGVHACGIRYRGRTDLLMVEFVPGTTVAGVFTRSKTRSAPVDWCRESTERGAARALVVNSGNANAFNGGAGIKAVRGTAAAVADLVACDPYEVLIASTGVIGVPLDETRITENLATVRASLSDSAWVEAAEAIMTTDTYSKMATRTAMIDGVEVRINGIAKGSGMIAPDMATMLGFVFTDAAIGPDVLAELLRRGTDRSFNCITVDSDTSTSDTLLVFATGQVAHSPILHHTSKRLKDFRAKFEDLLLDLAHQVVRDGEGAGKFVTVKVTGAAGNSAAKRIAMAIANSPLVKTAIAGEDANWGRIVMAVGKSGEKADRDLLKIAIGGITVAEHGQPVPGFDETPVASHMKGLEILVEVDIGLGKGTATVWTCDLTHAYIDINGSYRS